MTKRRNILGGLLVVTLGACSQEQGLGAERAFCTPLLTSRQVEEDAKAAEAESHRLKPPEDLSSSAAHYENLALDCLNRFARDYAIANDPVDSVARAVVNACRANIGYETSAAAIAREQRNMSFELVQLLKKDEEQRFAEVAGRLVVEARAGHCRPPRVHVPIERPLPS